MGYRIEGDGSYRKTIVWLDDEIVTDWDTLVVKVNKDKCEALLCPNYAEIDSWKPVDRMIISGIYMIVSDGGFTNTRVMIDDVMLRGVQQLTIQIDKEEHPMLHIDTVLLPNLVEGPNV